MTAIISAIFCTKNGALPEKPDKPDKHNLVKLAYVSSFYHNDMVPIWLDGALKKTTAINPQLRYDDLSEFIYDLSHPHPAFLNARQPLLERNPLWFWRGLSLLSLLANLILLYFVGK